MYICLVLVSYFLIAVLASWCLLVVFGTWCLLLAARLSCLVLADCRLIHAAGRSRFFSIFKGFRWIDVEIDARFVIYVKN